MNYRLIVIYILHVETVKCCYFEKIEYKTKILILILIEKYGLLPSGFKAKLMFRRWNDTHTKIHKENDHFLPG